MNATEAFERLTHARRRHRLAHAYLFNGQPRGSTGALTLRFLQSLACEALNAENEPCANCRTCRHVRERIWPDFHWIEPALKSRLIGIDQIRNLCDSMSQSALNGGWKAGIILYADRLSDAAANAFLKTLEEPASSTLLLLLTDQPQSLLPTLTSRCQRIDVAEAEAPPADVPWMETCLDILDIGADLGVIEKMARAESLCECFDQCRTEALTAVRADSQAELSNAEKQILEARAAGRYRERRTEILRTLLLGCHDIVRIKAGGDLRNLSMTNHRDRLQRKAAATSLPQALANLQVLDQLQQRLERNLPETCAVMAELDRLQ